MEDNLSKIVDKMNFKMTNIITNIASEYQNALVELFLEKIANLETKYEAVIIDAREIISGLKNFRSKIEKGYTDDEILSMDLEQLKNVSLLYKNEMRIYYENIYEEYIAISILLKIGCSNIEKNIYCERKKLIEEGNFDELLKSSSLCGSVFFFSGRRKRNIHKLIFLTNAQFIVDINLQDAINNFIDLNTDFFKFNVLTEMDTVFNRHYGFNSRDILLINGEVEKIHKKNTK